MQRGLLVEFSCNPHSLLDSPLESFACCEIICPWVTSGCYNNMLFSMRNFFPEYTDSLLKVYRLYDKLLDKISPKTELSVSNPSRKYKYALVSILPIQNNPPTCSILPSLSYKSLYFSSIPESEKPTVEMIMLTLILRYNHSALNNLCNLLYKYYKKILNWGDLSVKLRYC